MANVLDLLNPIAQPTMNGFDLSQKHVYGSAVGRIDCPLQIETVPKDKFKIDIGSLMRTMTPQTAPFLRGKITFDFYFVPYTQLWHPFNQFIDQRLDVHTSIQKGISRLPVIHLYDLFKLIYLVFQNTPYESGLTVPYYLKDIHNVPWFSNIFNMLDFFGYGNYLHIKSYILDTENFSYESFLGLIEPYKNKYVNVLRPAAYQHAWYDMYRNKFFDNYDYFDLPNLNDYVASFNFDDIDCSTFANSIIPIDTTDYTASCNMRIYMLFTQRYCQFKQDLIQSALPSQQFGAVSEVNVDISMGTIRSLCGAADFPDVSQNPSLSVFHYGTQDISENVVTLNNDSVLAGGFNVDNENLSTQIRTPHTHNIETTVSSAASKFDVIALKRAEALQKWRQNALRGGNMVDNSFRAHYGVKPRYESDNNVLKLGSFEGSLQVNTVETTAQSSGSGNTKVGNLGSNVLAVIEGKEINFECSDFGVIICLQYFRPESEYSSTMIDRANILSEPFDFFTEEFCNTGLDSVNMADYNANVNVVNNLTQPLGFASQYWWYKTALDKCHGQFSKYHCFYPIEGDIGPLLYKGNSVMWCAPRVLEMITSRDGSVYRNKSSLYVNPSILDDLFGVKYHDRFSDDIYLYFGLNDQLIFNTYFNVKAIRPMTIVGLPNF